MKPAGRNDDLENHARVPIAIVEVARGEPWFQFGWDRNVRAIHVQRSANPFAHERLKIAPCFPFNRVPEQRDPGVGIAESCARVLGQGVAG